MKKRYLAAVAVAAALAATQAVGVMGASPDSGAHINTGGGDGGGDLGEALRRCVESEEQGGARLRRMLACRRQEEACRMLRPLLSLIAARQAPLSHARLLDDLQAFRFEEARRRFAWPALARALAEG